MNQLPPAFCFDGDNRGRESRTRRIAIALVIAFFAGMAARYWAFTHTEPMRRETTQGNAFYWGDRMVREAHPAPGAASWSSLYRSYLGLYDSDKIAPPPPLSGHTLDYVPLRLLMAGVWVNCINLQYGPVSQWRPEFARSFAAFSLVMEITAAVAMFFLVGRFLKLAGPSTRLARWTHWEQAAAATILLWLNPASIIDSHVWPHGQTWVMAFYLLSILAMVEKRFFVAGAVFGLGTMFKGQMMLVAPALILWPMFDRRRTAAARVAIGIVFGMSIVVWPWVIHGDFEWARAGFAAKIEFHEVLRKELALNLPAILSYTAHLTLHQHLIDFRIGPAHVILEVKAALIALYGGLLVCCAWGIARMARTADRRFLVAIAAPWALMFYVMGQMDERYLVWGACFSAAAVVVSRRAVAAHLMLTWSAAAVNCESLLYDKPKVFPAFFHALHLLNPLTLALTTAGVVILFVETTTRSSVLKTTPAAPELRSNVREKTPLRTAA